jgi:phosphoribosylglycinamide formyltransferase-1
VSEAAIPRGARARVAVLISGRGSNMGALMAAAAQDSFPAEIVAVFSDKADAAGLDTARRAGIPAEAFPRAGHADKASHEAVILAALDAAKVDFVCLAGFMRLLSGAFIARWQGKIINIHPSLLPAFPGLDTHRRAIDAGCRIHGCSVHFVTEGMDEGPVIAQAAVPVIAGDTPDTLSARILTAEHILYPKALAMLARGDVAMSPDGRAVFAAGVAGDGGAMLVSAD